MGLDELTTEAVNHRVQPREDQRAALLSRMRGEPDQLRDQLMSAARITLATSAGVRRPMVSRSGATDGRVCPNTQEKWHNPSTAVRAAEATIAVRTSVQSCRKAGVNIRPSSEVIRVLNSCYSYSCRAANGP